jgi:hypothetical protein
MKYILITILLFIFLHTIKPWFLCRGFKDEFHFDYNKIQLVIDDHNHNDFGQNIILVRMIHNKLIYFSVDVIKKYIKFFDFLFLTKLLSPLVAFFLYTNFYYLFKFNHYTKTQYVFLFLLIILPFIETLYPPKINFDIKLYVFTFPYFALSVFGITSSMKHSKNKFLFFMIVVLLALISYAVGFIFEKDVFIYCQ